MEVAIVDDEGLDMVKIRYIARYGTMIDIQCMFMYPKYKGKTLMPSHKKTAMSIVIENSSV